MLEKWGYRGDVKDVARVIATHGDYYYVVCEDGEGVARKKPGAFFNRPGAVVPTTGDFVRLKWNGQGESRILETLPRTSKFERVDPSSSGRKAQVIAVNYDTLFLLMSANRNFSVRRMERFLSMARSGGGETVVVITKCDLDANGGAAFVGEAMAHAGDARVIGISSLTGKGLDEVRKYAGEGKTLAFVGSSGVGKSTLVNALAEDELMPTLETREWDDKGRHTTTERELVMLPCGAMVIDTPGMREIGMWEADCGIGDSFEDVERLFAGCRFSDCRHDTEPGCAVKAAIADGSLSEERWLAYRRLKAESAGQAVVQVKSSHRYRK